MKDLEKLLMKGKKSGEEKLSPDDIQAKMDVLMELLEMAKGAMGEKVKGDMEGMKKVTVAAPDKQGLEAGLEKAQELLPKMEHMEEEQEETPEEESKETPEMEAKEEQEMAKPEDEEEEDMFAKKRAKMKNLFR